MIEITRTAELRQLEESGFKFAGYFPEGFAEAFLALQRQAKETGRKMILTLQDDAQGTLDDNLSIPAVEAQQLASILDGVSKAPKRETIAGSKGKEPACYSAASLPDHPNESGRPGLNEQEAA